MEEKIWIDFEKLPSFMLINLLRNDFENGDKPFLSEEEILHICSILVERQREADPSSLSDVNQKWEEFKRRFLDDAESLNT